jgi:hypothetical protein
MHPKLTALLINTNFVHNYTCNVFIKFRFRYEFHSKACVNEAFYFFNFSSNV